MMKDEKVLEAAKAYRTAQQVVSSGMAKRDKLRSELTTLEESIEKAMREMFSAEKGLKDACEEI